MRASYEKYARLRDEQDLTDYEVSQQSGVAASTLSNWKATVDERQAGYRPKIDSLARIAKVLRCDITDLIEE